VFTVQFLFGFGSRYCYCAGENKSYPYRPLPICTGTSLCCIAAHSLAPTPPHPTPAPSSLSSSLSPSLALSPSLISRSRALVRTWFLRDYPCFSSTFGGSRGHFHLVSHRRSLLCVTSSLQVLQPLSSKFDVSGLHLPANFENLNLCI